MLETNQAKTMDEQRELARSIGSSFVGMKLKRNEANDFVWHFEVRLLTIGDAQWWFDGQCGMCRVYDSKGNLRFAK